MVHTMLTSIRDEALRMNAGRFQFVLAGFFFKIALDVSYATYLTSAFANHFLTPFVVNFSLFQYIESFSWLAIVLLFVPFSSKSAGGLAFFAAVIFLYAPVTSIYGMDDERSRYAVLLCALAIGAAYLSSATDIRHRVNISLPKNGQRYLLAISFLFSGLFLAIALSSGALFTMNFDIARVYELRSELGARVDIGLLAYTNLWAQKIFTPLIFAIGLHRKSLWMIVLALTMHLIYFGVTQHRSHLFAPILVYVVFLLYRREFSYAGGFGLLGLALVSLNLAILAFDLEDFGALTIRRALFVGPSVTYS
jgi:hypothetical protein